MPICDYSKTIIYKIVCNNLGIQELYVGRTTNFAKRKNHHKSDCNNIKSDEYNLNVYKVIRENGGFDNWTMVLVEDFPCKSKLEGASRERYWFEVLNATLNSCVPNRNTFEYYIDNKAKIDEYNKQYRIENDLKMKTKCNCLCGGKYTNINISTHDKTQRHKKYLEKQIKIEVNNEIIVSPPIINVK